jgi:cell volume regulation protein A
MFPVDGLLLTAALLVLAAIAASKLSTRAGLPVLVLFVAVGMLAGSEGPGGLAFENYALAHGVGTLALVLILFDGGLRTSTAAFRQVAVPATLLATVGVAVTSAVTGLAAAWILGLGSLEGLLLGSIVGSTDAAAVFAVLRSKGVRLQPKLSSVLEVESGANDPMAVFLTVCLAEILVGQRETGPGLAGFFLQQMLLGAAVGGAFGWVATRLVNRIRLGAAGLYPVLTSAIALLAYGTAALVGGSGFLAVYLAGIVLGNRRLVFRNGILLFHDGMAWLSQIVMFVLLGLLAFPSRVFGVAAEGLLVAGVLMLVARPVAVALCLLPLRFDWREGAFVSWVGLRGAVPVVLATIPLLLGVPEGTRLFDVVFFVVLVSASLQGWTVPHAARLLGLQAPPAPESPVTLEITSLQEVASDILEVTLAPDSAAAGRLVRELELPESIVIAMLVRGGKVVPTRGSTRLEAGDHVFLVLESEARALAERAFGAKPPPD